MLTNARPAIGVRTSNVSAALPDDVTRHIMAIARAHGRDAIPVIQQGEPIAKHEKIVRLLRGRVQQFHRIKSKTRSAQILAGDRIEVRGGERLKIIMHIPRMIQHHHPSFGHAAERLH
jgi:hypothetical protein